VVYVSSELFSLDGRDHVVVSTGRIFGIQAFSYESGKLSEFLKSHSVPRLLQYSRLQLSTYATDDAIIIGVLSLVQTEIKMVADDFITFYGDGAHAKENDLLGNTISIIGYHVNLRVAPGLASLTEKAMLRTSRWGLM
jgi:hypothetical protein